jgi:hypothetical protein
VASLHFSPRVEGRPLREWVLDLSLFAPGSARRKAEAVIVNHGTNGLPAYLKMLNEVEKDPSKLIQRVKSWAALHFETHEGTAIEPSNLLAARAIVLLGTNANSVVPELEHMLTNSNRVVLDWTLFALSRIDAPEARAVYAKFYSGPSGADTISNEISDGAKGSKGLSEKAAGQ